VRPIETEALALGACPVGPAAGSRTLERRLRVAVRGAGLASSAACAFGPCAGEHESRPFEREARERGIGQRPERELGGAVRIAAGDEERRRLLGAELGAVRAHMRRLGGKDYWAQSGASPDFVIMFLPGEAFFSAALQSDPELIEFGAAEKVVPATPTTLIALLRSVQYGWSQERVAANAQAVSDLGRELYNRMNTLAEHVAGIGNGLDKAVRCYNEAVGSLERKVLPQARRFKELGVTAQGIEIEPLQPVERAARTPAAPELLSPMRVVGGGEQGA